MGTTGLEVYQLFSIVNRWLLLQASPEITSPVQEVNSEFRIQFLLNAIGFAPL